VGAVIRLVFLSRCTTCQRARLCAAAGSPKARHHRGGTDSSEDRPSELQRRNIGIFDYQCPTAKHLILSLGGNGLGANIRVAAVAGLLAGLAANRIVVFNQQRICQRNNNISDQTSLGPGFFVPPSRPPVFLFAHDAMHVDGPRHCRRLRDGTQRSTTTDYCEKANNLRATKAKSVDHDIRIHAARCPTQGDG
jgi:hypothetical protein